MLKNHLKNSLTNKLIKTTNEYQNIKTSEINDHDLSIESLGLESIDTNDVHIENTLSANCFNSGYLSPYFINNIETKVANYKNPYIFLYKNEILGIRSILPLLEKIVALEIPLFIIAEDYDNEVLSTLLINYEKEVLKVIPVKVPDSMHKDVLFNELALITNSSIITDVADINFDNLSEDIFGTVKQVIVSKEKSILIPTEKNRSKINRRYELISSQIKNQTDQYNFQELQESLLILAEQEIEHKYYNLFNELEVESVAKFFERIPVLVPEQDLEDTEIKVSRWYKKVGDKVFKDEIILELETDKVIVEVTSPEEGYIWHILGPEGEKVELGQRLALIENMDYETFQ